MADGEYVPPGTVIIEDSTAPVSDRVTKALENMDNIKAAILQEQKIVAPAIAGETEAEVIADVEIPKIVERMYPDLDEDERQTVSEIVHTSMVVGSTGGLFDEADLPPNAQFEEGSDPKEEQTKPARPGADFEAKPDRKFVMIGNKFVNIENLNIDLIKQVNPFQGAYEILSKAVTTDVLKTIQDTVVGMRSSMSEEEAVILWPRIQEFAKAHGRKPSHTSSDPYEKRLAEALAYINNKRREHTVTSE
jgi:hypothetical protein